MKYTTLCRQHCSVVGLGSPRRFRAGQDDKQAGKLILAAHDLGINFFDTAPAYGSEHNLAILKPYRHKCLISSKSPHRLAFRAGWKTVPGRLRLSLENSLRQLQTDYIDFYFLHAISWGVYQTLLKDETIWETLHNFKSEGKVRFLGISEDEPKDKERNMVRHELWAQNFDVVMLAHKEPQVSTIETDLPTIGMLINGRVTAEHIKRYTVTLTGTSNIEHLKENISEVNFKS